MQLFYLPTPLTLFLFFVLWGIFQTGAAFISTHLPDRFFQERHFLYRTRKFEKQGKFYQKWFFIRHWKHLLPDGASAIGGYKKRHLTDFSTNNLEKFLVESRKAELTHWLAIPFFWVFGLFAPPIVLPLMFAYAVLVNFPCIIAQRYNRPRIQGLLAKQQRKASSMPKPSLPGTPVFPVHLPSEHPLSLPQEGTVLAYQPISKP